ncbi:MAG: gluconate 2-dehydrogenase subunit 3 family protein, partial [Terriglobia bacterium]
CASCILLSVTPTTGTSRTEGRRKALRDLALTAGAATFLPVLDQARPASAACGCGDAKVAEPHSKPEPEWKPLFFDQHQNEMVIAFTDLIIPSTGTPGAREALVNRCIDLFLNEEEADVQQKFVLGLNWIDSRSFSAYGKPFTALGASEQTKLIEPLADPENGNPADRPGIEFFQDIKDWTIFGYYTSQIGLEQELQYGGDAYHDSFPGACTHPEHQS